MKLLANRAARLAAAFGMTVSVQSACCSINGAECGRVEQLDVEPIGAVQLFWDSCQAFDKRGVSQYMAADPEWDAERAMRCITGGQTEAHISDPPAPLFAVRRLTMHNDATATVVGDILEKSGDRALVDWTVLYHGYDIDVTLVDGEWKVIPSSLQKHR